MSRDWHADDLSRVRLSPSLCHSSSINEVEEWRGTFTFVQIADTQLGLLASMGKLWWLRLLSSATCGLPRKLGVPVIDVMERQGEELVSRTFTVDDAYNIEEELMKETVQSINALSPRPAFVVVCGDLVNAFPTTFGGKLQREEVERFKSIMEGVHSDIELVCVCGNHDVGDRPNAGTIETFTSRFGADYFTFKRRGIRFCVINSQLYKDSTDCQDLAAAQHAWFEKQMSTRMRTVIFSHISPFIRSPEEPSAYFNLDKETRMKLLNLACEGGTEAIMAGHYHRNAEGVYRGVQVITTGAVGANITSVNGASEVDLLGLAGMEAVVSDRTKSGYRLVKVSAEGIEHEFVPLDTSAQTMQSKRK